MCGTLVSVDDEGRIVDVRGDRAHVMTTGYACIKGLQAPHIHHGSSRLLHPLKRMGDGHFVRIPLEQALDEIAAKLRSLIDADSPRAVALYRGTQNYFNSTAAALLRPWLAALGSPGFFSSATIDQSSKFVTASRLGTWEAGLQSIESSDVWMAVGFNPLVSVQALMGFPTLNPTRRMHELKARGLKIIVIDPRRTETARHADLHLQPYPGQDAALAAGLLKIIFDEGWHDAEFCAQNVNGLAELHGALHPFTPDNVASRAGVAKEDLIAVARLFAQQSRRGFVTTCTGPNMVHHSNLAHHLYESINVVCGRFKRTGESVSNPGVLSRRSVPHAQARTPTRGWERGPRSRVSDCHGFYGEMMSNTLNDEILQPGPGRIRGLLVFGGNPLAAFPDQRKTERAFRALGLLVTVDPVMTNTARLSHYILPPRVLYEREDMTNFMETGIYPEPFAQYTPAVAAPPPGSEVVEDWYVLWALASRLGVTLELDGVALDMKTPPATGDLLRIMARDGNVPFEEIARHPGGHLFDLPALTVQPPDAKAGRFELAPADVLDEMSVVAREEVRHGAYIEEGRGYTHLLAVRRMREVVNSALHDVPAIRHRMPRNPVWMHPDDMIGLGLAEGDPVEVIGSQGQVEAVARRDGTQRRGVVAMSHCWGPLPGEDATATQLEQEGRAGGNVNLLTSTEKYIEPINAMARMSGIPVNIVKQGAIQ